MAARCCGDEIPHDLSPDTRAPRSRAARASSRAARFVTLPTRPDRDAGTGRGAWVSLGFGIPAGRVSRGGSVARCRSRSMALSSPISAGCARSTRTGAARSSPRPGESGRAVGLGHRRRRQPFRHRTGRGAAGRRGDAGGRLGREGHRPRPPADVLGRHGESDPLGAGARHGRIVAPARRDRRGGRDSGRDGLDRLGRRLPRLHDPVGGDPPDHARPHAGRRGGPPGAAAAGGRREASGAEHDHPLPRAARDGPAGPVPGDDPGRATGCCSARTGSPGTSPTTRS